MFTPGVTCEVLRHGSVTAVGYPDPTFELPARRPDIADEVSKIALDPEGRRDELLALLSTDEGPPAGHLCSTCWVFDPTGEWTLLVRHRVIGWVAPGGHSEPHESLLAGAERELLEETGLSVTSALSGPALLHPVTARGVNGHADHTHWNVGFLFVADRSTLLTPEAGSPVEWFPVHPLSELPTPSVPDLVANLPRLVALLRSERGRRTVD